MVTLERFKKLSIPIIKVIEGGYYHPDMMIKEPIKFKKYKSSGETMFGLDRYAGHNMFYFTPRGKISPIQHANNVEAGKYKYKNDTAKNFWSIMDNNKARYNWKHNYIPPEPLKSKLLNLTAELMYPEFLKQYNSKINLQTQKVIEDDDKTLLNIIYLTWNGAGYFDHFGKLANETVVNKGIKDSTNLNNIILAERKNFNQPGYIENAKNLIRQSADSIKNLYNKFADIFEQKKTIVSNNIKDKFEQNNIKNNKKLIYITIGILIFFYFKKSK